jgi:hypothetical protein
MVDLSPPSVLILSPQNKTYDSTDLPLTFEVNEPTSWMAYSLDGQPSVVISGNATLAVLPEGSHSVVVFANDTAGNAGTSGVIYFDIAPFPIILVAAVVVTAVIIVAVVLIYFKKPRKQSVKQRHDTT